MGEDDAHLNAEYARFYDWMHQGYEADIPFYARLAEQRGGPILEVACGTGRLTMALARAGHEVVGIDRSAAMLDIARAKLADEPTEVRERIELVEADMTDFDLGRAFACVFVPNASIFHVAGRFPLRRCMACLYAHTRPGGVAVVDAVSPVDMSEQNLGHPVLITEGVNPATGLLTREYKQAMSVSWATQTVRVEHVFVEGEGDDEKRVEFVQQYRWLEQEEGSTLLRRAGYPEVDVLGDFDGGPFTDDSPRLILVAHRLDRDVR
jgi:SAM-dependent methyltransferase